MQELSENFNAEVNYKQINVTISEMIKIKSTTNMDTKYFYRAPSPLKNSCYYFDVEKVCYLSNGRGTKRNTKIILVASSQCD